MGLTLSGAGLESESYFTNDSGHETAAYGAPDIHQHGRASRPYDMWSLGCVFLEIMNWALATDLDLDEFAMQRLQEIPDAKGHPNATFWYMDTAGGLHLKPAVVNKLAELREACTGRRAFKRLVEIIEILMAIKPEDRPGASALCSELDAILLESRSDLSNDADYCRTAQAGSKDSWPPWDPMHLTRTRLDKLDVVSYLRCRRSASFSGYEVGPVTDQSRMSRRVSEQNAQSKARPLAPKQECHDDSSSTKAKIPKIVEVTSDDGTIRHKAEIPRTTRQQPQRKTTFRQLCDDHPQGFHGEHELRRHIERHHTTYRKVWIEGATATVEVSNNQAGTQAATRTKPANHGPVKSALPSQEIIKSLSLLLTMEEILLLSRDLRHSSDEKLRSLAEQCHRTCQSSRAVHFLC
jgi:serine/threonine protein kinase